MKAFNLFSLLLSMILCAESTLAQDMDYVIDPGLNTGIFYSQGAVSHILLHSDDEMLISGSYTSVNLAGTQTLIDYNGNLIFNIGIGNAIGPPKVFHYKNQFLSCGVSVLQVFDNGGTNYSFQFEFQKSAYNGFLGNDVMDAIVEPDDNILAAGRFFTDSMDISPEKIRQLCRVDSTGAPDPDFPMLHCNEPIDAFIRDMETLSDGSIIITGLFTEIEGYTYNQIGKLNPDFSVDTSFVNSFDPGGQAAILLIDSQDRIWLKALSSNLIGQPPLFGSQIIRLLPNGEVDPDFIIPDLYHPISASNSLNGFLNDIIEMPDGKFILGGGFTSINGHERLCIAMIEDDGTVVNGVLGNIGPDEAIWGPVERFPLISNIRLLDDGKLLLGGSFSSFGGADYHCLIRLQPQPVSTREAVKKETLRIYPNPALDRFFVKGPENHASFKNISLYDLAGRKVFSKANHYAELPIEILDVTPGMYVVNAGTAAGNFSGRLVVE